MTIIKLIGEGRHVGAFNAHAQRVVNRVKAQAIQSRGIAQIGRRWRHADACRAVTGARIAMAHRALLGIQRRAASRVWSDNRSLADLIGHRQFCAQLPCLTSDIRAIFASSDSSTKAADALLQLCAFRFGRQIGDQTLQHLQEFLLFTVFGFIDDFARLDRRRVIGANVIEQMQGLGRTFCGFGQRIEAAERDHRQHEPRQKTGGGNHEQISNGNTK